MSFLLCHDCYTWVEPLDDCCPDCLLFMDLSVADPPFPILREVIGELRGRLGEVRIPRRLLPEWGTLYTTTAGLFFVPHEIDDAQFAEELHSTGDSVWALRSRVWSPLVYLLPMLRGFAQPQSPVQCLRPRLLTEADGSRLPGLLMENPGAFFLPRHHIRGILRRRTRWIIERCPGSDLQISPVDPHRDFHENLTALLHSREWQGLQR